MDLGTDVLIPKICFSWRICCGIIVGMPDYISYKIIDN